MSLEIAKEFAAFLDANQYDDASQLLAEDCDYHYSEGSYRGNKNIINIYKQNDLQSKKIFDETTYSSEVEELPDGNYRITFVDKIRKGHKWHEYKCYQLIQCADGRIIHIEHREIPGEMESLRMFYSTSRSQGLNLP